MGVDISFLKQGSVTVARQLLGWQLFAQEADGSLTGGTIVETEAYDQADAASHSYRGKTKRNEIMFGPAGAFYVYFTYGMHWCANIVTGAAGHGEAVLIRSILPQTNIELIRQRRAHRPDHELTNGPAKLCQALNITGADNGTVVNETRLLLRPPENDRSLTIQATKRIGIRNDTEKLWRFVATQYV